MLREALDMLLRDARALTGLPVKALMRGRRVSELARVSKRAGSMDVHVTGGTRFVKTSEL